MIAKWDTSGHSHIYQIKNKTIKNHLMGHILNYIVYGSALLSESLQMAV